MPKEAEIKRRVDWAKKRFTEYSARLQDEQRSKQMFPSTVPGDRGATSPLGGLAEWPWGGEKKGG
jgi:hypothetical protein